MVMGTEIGAARKASTASARSSAVMSPRRRIAHSALATSAKMSAGATNVAPLFRRPAALAERSSSTNHFTTTLASTT